MSLSQPGRPSGSAPAKKNKPSGYVSCFSALTDADFLDTERFFKGERDLGERPSLAALRDRLDSFLDDLATRKQPSPVNAMRARVLAARAAADLAPGAFTLTVPPAAARRSPRLSPCAMPRRTACAA